MKLLLLNYSYLQHELRELGHEVTSAGLQDDCDIVCTLAEYDLPSILQRLDYAPDWVIFMDSIERVIPTGLEQVDILLAVYYIDSTLNRYWQHPLADIASLALTDQKPDAVFLSNRGVNAHWFPLAADSLIYQPAEVEKEYELSFIGHRHPQNRIKRENILNGLANRFKVTYFSGDPHLSAEACAMVYQRSKLVLNENLFPAVNLRLFEAMACGTAVLTEDNAPGLSELFVDSRDMIAYNAENLIERVEHYLANEAEHKRIADRAAYTIGREHSFGKRAQQLTELLTNTQPAQVSESLKHTALAEAFLNYSLKWSEKDQGRSHREAQHLLDTSIPDGTIALRQHGLEGLLSILSGDLNAARQSFMAACDLAPESGSAQDMLAITELALADQAEGNRLQDLNFHLQRGELLLKSGLAFQPGLMAQNLPVHFWSAMEHFMYVAQHAPEVWELVGDLMMQAQAPDQAVNAYKAAPQPNQDRLAAAEKQAYLRL